LSAVLAALAFFSYAFIYTPLKRFSPTAVLVGAFPGALPVLIGSVSAAGSITTFAWLLFAIQFVWQFPHFWSIAWVAFEDYNRAGYHLLPSSSGRSGRSAWYNIMYISVLIPVSLLPWYFELAGNFSALVISVTGILFLWQAIQLFRKQTESAARQLMFGSFFYLPIVQLALYFDKL
jgi:protoheme IX farnesyltransferase